MNTRPFRARLALALSAALALGLAGVLSAPRAAHAAPPAPPAKADGKDAKKFDPATATKKDQLVLKTGRTIDGVILEETETSVKMLVIFSDTLRTESSYPKSDILEIKRDAFKTDPAPEKDKKDADDKDKKDDAKKDEPKDEAVKAAPGQMVDINGKPVPEGATKIYVVNFGGEFGRDLSKTPLKAIVDEMVRVQPDIIIARFDHDFALYGREQEDYELGVGQYDQLEKARELNTLLAERIANSGEFKSPPRTVAWIKKALGGAAFLPFTFKEIYFTTDGRHGQLGGLERMFGSMGDDVVREKQRSLRLARARGLAEQGGHDGRIMTAMSRGDYILSYRIVGGQVEFIEKMPPSPEWFCIKDDGPVNEAHRDTAQDLVRLRGNDYLTLDAKTALEIGFSSGTADTLDELLNKMGVTRNYAVVKNRSKETLSSWSKEVDGAERDIQRLIRDFRSVEVKPPGGYEQRTAARGRRISILQQLQNVVNRYAEAINPRRFGDAEGMISDINVAIDRLKTEQRLDRRP